MSGREEEGPAAWESPAPGPACPCLPGQALRRGFVSAPSSGRAPTHKAHGFLTLA